MSATTTLRKELHEFGPFTIEIWESDRHGKIKVNAEAKIMGWLMFFRCREEPFDDIKAGVKEMLIDAMKRYQRQCEAWDNTQTSTRP